MDHYFDSLGKFQQVEFTLDTVSFELEEKLRLCRVLRDVYNNDIKDQFFTYNPVVLIKSL